MVNVADFSSQFLLVVLGTIGLALFGIFFGLIYKGIDRKLSAHM
jgi:formate hydrogenlyase subunit 4